MSNDIPRKFCNANDPEHPVKVETVGELRAALEQLPADVRVGYPGDETAVIVFNVGHETQHLKLEKEEDWEDECDD